MKCLINDNFLSGSIAKTERFSTSRVHELKGYYKEYNNFNLVNYGQGQIIGGIEFMQNSGEYLYSTKCETDVELIIFNIKNIRQINKIKKNEIFKNRIDEQIKYFQKRINDINTNRKNLISTKQNKYIKTFIENNKDKQKNIIHNIFENKIQVYKPKNFSKMKIKNISVDFKNDNKTKNKFLIKYNQTINSLYFHRNKISVSQGFNRNKTRNNKTINSRNNCIKLQQKSNYYNKTIESIDKIKNFLSNHDNSITTNICSKSSYIVTDRNHSENFNSVSTNLYFTSVKEKEEIKENKNDKYILLSKKKGSINKEKRINLFKEDKRTIKFNIKEFNLRKLCVVRDKCNEKNIVSTILRNMFFSPQNKKLKSLY